MIPDVSDYRKVPPACYIDIIVHSTYIVHSCIVSEFD